MRWSWWCALVGCAPAGTADAPVMAVAIEQACSAPACHAPAPSPEVAPPREGMVDVPAGTFERGCDANADCQPYSQPAHEVYLDHFAIDRVEVTVERYAVCVAEGGCSAAGNDGECTAARADGGELPINCVSWDQAQAYCAWADKRLPTEAEWEKAARGRDGRAFPWGNEPASCELAVMYDAGALGCGAGAPLPVGSRPQGASPYGALDMAGNLWEWTADWYRSGYDPALRDNPPGPEHGEERVVRGGSWDDMWGERAMRITERASNAPATSGRHLGFRCVVGR
jgi:formylglycine-generating enzyme required for sulfatase activity